ncbi:hypothetical protein V6N13_104568 [Hibiscus sabdariffa]|uniref:Uncharacterized protein n=2 Tax=Hibiscus sabdariffa TaxID=183260 RepID=A0ABR2DD41_9ROSI
MSRDNEVVHELRLPNLKIENGIVIQEESECKTPSSKENKIPAAVSCPPAPKKPKRRAVSVSCKRNLFDVVNGEEVDAFFSAAFDDSVSKRRCLVLYMNWSYEQNL